MAEVDPLIFKILADSKAARKEVADFQRVTGQGLSRVERNVLKLEAQMKRSTGAIGNSLKGLAGTLGTYFTGRELAGLIDGFTRLQNSLKVAGLEGQNLETVQSQLLALSSKYGVSVEGLADLYGKTAQTANELGASQSQLVQLTEASSQALKITGTSATAAQGALLGLTQALASGVVRAEEFNQINEGGLRPLLQVAANTERFGGSVAKLRIAVTAGKVSSQEFFQAILAGAADLDAKASKATLTLSGAFEALSSKLTVYVGQSAQANGATAALAGGIKLLADNLDTIIPALALIAATMGTSLVVSAIAGSRALFALTAAMGGAATAAEAATFAFGGLGAVLTGPVGIAAAIVAVGAGLVYLANQTRSTADAAKELEDASRNVDATLDSYIEKLKEGGASTEELGRISAIAAGKVDGLADSYNRASVQAHKLATEASKATIELLKQQAAISAASKTRQAQLEREKRDQDRARTVTADGIVIQTRPVNSAKVAELDRQIAEEKRLQARTDAAQEAVLLAGQRGIDLANSKPPGSTSTDKPNKTKAPRSRAAADPLDQDFRNAQELRQFQLEELRAKEQDATAATKKAGYAREALALEAEMRRADIDEAVRKKELTKDEADARRKIVDSLYGSVATEGEILVQGREAVYQREITRREQEQIARQQTDAMRDELDALGAESGVTDVRKARVAIERRMLDIQQEIERKLLDEAIARGDVLDAAQARAALARKQSADRTGFERDNKGPLGQYLDEVRKVGLNMDDEFEKVAVNGLRSLNDGLADAIVNSKNLGDVFSNVAKQIIADLIRIAIQQTIVNALAKAFNMGGGGGGGGGGILNTIGSALKIGAKVAGSRASGGPVEAGRLYRINESGIEGFVPATSGKIIPAGQMNAIAARGGGQGAGVAKVQIELSGDIDGRIVSVAGPVIVDVVRAAAPATIEAAAQETTRRLTRPRMPGAGR
jgi:tape measure domain-containing protein